MSTLRDEISIKLNALTIMRKIARLLRFHYFDLDRLLLFEIFLLHVPSLLKSCQMVLCDLVSVSDFLRAKRFG